MQTIDERPVMVTVYAVAYNHAKYIRQALDGILMQETNFRFEILVHDDASTDETADIIREYEAKYPELIKSIIQKENLYSRHIPRNKNYLLPMTRSKYIALCECDDYWTDHLKLQRQFDALEKHPECLFCAGRAIVINENGEPLDKMLPRSEIATGVMSQEDFLRLVIRYGFQTSTYFVRTDSYRGYISNKPEYTLFMLGDISLLHYFVSKGPVYCINDQLSCYRWQSTGSWTSKFWNQPVDKIRDLYLRYINGKRKYDAFTHGKFHDVCEEHVDYMIELIARLEFKDAEKNKDYKTMLKKKYAEFRPHWKKRDYCFAWLMAYCPWLMNSLKACKRLLKK